MIRSITFITLALIAVATLWPTPASAQQFFPATRREVTLSTGFISGASTFNLNLSYRLPASPLDVLFRVTSLSSAGTTSTGFLLGGRYYFGIPSPMIRPYLVAGFSTLGLNGRPPATSGSLVFGAGASLDLPGTIAPYGSLITNTAAGGLGYDAGIQFGVRRRTSLLIGVSGARTGGTSSSAAYAGLSVRF